VQHTASPFKWFSALDQTSIDITLAVGGSVSWRYSATAHNVEETDSTYQTGTKVGGFVSGPIPDTPSGTQVYTLTFDATTIGTHYYVCRVHGPAGLMRGTITVQTPGSGGSSTGTNYATALSASFTVLCAAIALAFALTKSQ